MAVLELWGEELVEGGAVAGLGGLQESVMRGFDGGFLGGFGDDGGGEPEQHGNEIYQFHTENDTPVSGRHKTSRNIFRTRKIRWISDLRISRREGNFGVEVG